ncbi:MAG: cell division protein FtsQ/DivIB [Rhodospirillaceae bacterium]
MTRKKREDISATEKQDESLKARKIGQPRKVVLRGRLSRVLMAGALVIVGTGMAAGGWWVWRSDVLPQMPDQAKSWVVDSTAKAGLRIEEIFVTGRSQTTREKLLVALKLNRGQPMFGFDPDDARKRVEKLPWVKSAVVERMLPGTVQLHITERVPMALWQNQGAFQLIDEDGKVILKSGLERFSDLPVVVGLDAPEHAKALLETLRKEPDLMAQVRAAVRVSGRRWNLVLENGIDVQLPEDNPAAAWLRLAEYERQHKVLDRDVEALDLRLPDRLIVRKATKPKPEKRPRGQET